MRITAHMVGSWRRSPDGVVRLTFAPAPMSSAEILAELRYVEADHAAILRARGWSRGSDGRWSDPSGQLRGLDATKATRAVLYISIASAAAKPTKSGTWTDVRCPCESTRDCPLCNGSGRAGRWHALDGALMFVSTCDGHEWLYRPNLEPVGQHHDDPA